MRAPTIAAVFAAAALACAASAAPAVSRSVPKGWTEDVAAARRRAADEGKLVFMSFSGSDWCGYCRMMDAEVFSSEEFVKAASDKYVLVMIDMPRDRSSLSELAAGQNPGLVGKYGVRGFPSMVVTDSAGAVVRRTSGYVKGGPKAFLAELGKLMDGVEWPAPASGKNAK